VRGVGNKDGTGPDIIGKLLANPLAAIRAAGMRLAHVGHRDAARAIETAASAVIKTGKVTRGLGGTLSPPRPAKPCAWH
jgi:isocitrate/isopropylmalate dehydrogenase